MRLDWLDILRFELIYFGFSMIIRVKNICKLLCCCAIVSLAALLLRCTRWIWYCGYVISISEIFLSFVWNVWGSGNG
jgi:hypothetical protein